MALRLKNNFRLSSQNPSISPLPMKPSKVERVSRKSINGFHFYCSTSNANGAKAVMLMRFSLFLANTDTERNKFREDFKKSKEAYFEKFHANF